MATKNTTSPQRQAVKLFAYIFIHLKSCVEKKESEKQTFSFPSANTLSPCSQNILITGKKSYNSMYKRKPKWNLNLTDHFNRNARVGRLWITYTHQNLGNKLAINVTKKGETKKKTNLFDFMSTLWCSSGKTEAKIRPQTLKYHPELTSDRHTDQPAVVRLSESLPAWHYKPAL